MNSLSSFLSLFCCLFLLRCASPLFGGEVSFFVAHEALYPLVSYADTLSARETAFQDQLSARLAELSSLHTVPCPLGSSRVRLSASPILPSSLRVVRSTLAELPPLGLDSTATILEIEQETPHPRDTIWVAFLCLPYPLQREWNAYMLLDSASSAEQPLWKRMQAERQERQRSPSTLPPFTLKGYAEREATLGESVQSPFAGRMHLELSGELAGGLQVRGELADQSLPFQPDGTSSQIRALDRIYLRVFDSLWYAEAGDIPLRAGDVFLHYETPIQGGGLGFAQGRVLQDTVRGGATAMPSERAKEGYFALGVAKGEFAEVELLGLEGIQGPYRLQGGGAGLLQVTALAGSEQVYLDGRLLLRGEDQDYTIDYNLGEVRFTPRHPIHAASRIRIRYEKVARRYTRYLMHGGGNLSIKRGWQLGVKGYLAHDAASSLQLDGQATEEERAAAYDALGELSSTEAAVHFQPPLVKEEGRLKGGYLLADTVVAGISYLYYRYVAPGQVDSLYRPLFQYVPEGGDYLQSQGEGNEPIYLWIAPLHGQHRGTFAVGGRLTPPESHQVVQSSVGKKSQRGEVRFTLAYSTWDRNTLQRAEGHRHGGIATSIDAHYKLFRWKKHDLLAGFTGRWVQESFRPVRDFLSPDALRLWGLSQQRIEGTWGDAALWLQLRNPLGQAKVTQKMILTPHLKGWALGREADYLWRSFAMQTSAGIHYLQGRDWKRWTNQLRGELAYRAKQLTPSLFFESEEQLTKGGQTPAPDYRWWQTGLRFRRGDSTQTYVDGRLTYRYDAATLLPTLLPLRKTLEFSTQAGVRAFSVLLHYQRQWAQQGKVWLQTQTVLSQLASRFAVWKRRIAGAVVEELSTENTPEWQHHFIRVPDGQGRYTWIDANGDGLQQLDEFVPAPFRDQGAYVLQRVPSSKTRATKTASVRLSINLTPRAADAPIDSGTARWLRWDVETETFLVQKRTERAWWQIIVPLGDAPHALQHQWMGRATLWYNRAARPVSLFVGGSASEQGERMAQGGSTLSLRTLRGGWVTPDAARWILEGEGSIETRHQHLPYGTATTLQVTTQQVRLTFGVRHQTGTEQRIEGRFARFLFLGKNTAARMWETEYALRLPLGTKWQGEGRLCYAHAALAAMRGNALAYTLSHGYQEGSNLLADWTLRWKITHYLMLSLRYELRLLGTLPVQHAGNFGIRTVF